MKSRVRFIGAWLLANVLILLGYIHKAKAKSLRGEHILSIYFHKPSALEFESCIKWLKKNNFLFLSTTDIYNIINNRLPFPKGAVVLTADDGWQSNEVNIVKVAEKYKIPITIFVSTDPVERGTYWWSYLEEANRKKIETLPVEQLKKLPDEDRLTYISKLKEIVPLQREALTIDQIKKISTSSYVTIGGHTLSHPILNNCKDEQVYHELLASREKLKNWTGKEVDFFAYPNGDYSEREVKMLYKQGYKLAFTVAPQYLTPAHLTNCYELPRFEVIEDAPFAETICRMMGVWQPFILKVKAILKKKPNNKTLHVPPHPGSKRVVAA